MMAREQMTELDMDIDQDWSTEFTDEAILRMKAQVRPLPLPPHLTPQGGIPLENLDDETLMTAPPHIIAHMQRTAAQGGLQVVSPRQVPFSFMMRRVSGAKKNIGDHIVGSTARQGTEWPTVFGDSTDHWLPDEPLPSGSSERAHRGKTRAVSLTTSTYELCDPILACLIRGRAVIDILRRDDVQGDADAYTDLLAKAWGIDRKDLDDLDAYTLGVDGPLLRHAIKADEVYATMYAPIHVRRCISVGCHEVTRAYLPDDSAMDWRRMRVFCEAVFALAVSIEGLPIVMMTAVPPPGDTGAPGNRPNVMCFQPSPAICWTYEGSTFSLSPLAPDENMRPSAIPREVMAALTKYVGVVRPVSHLIAKGVRLGAARSVTAAVNVPIGETITSSYRMMVQSVSVGAARGKVAAATMRNVIFSALEQAPLETRMRIVRYIKIASDEVKMHLGLRTVPDSMIVKLANRFLTVGALIRAKVVAEAARRGHSAAAWWADILAQAPTKYENFVEGSKGWAVIGFWLLFRAPTDKWSKLNAALNFSALRDAELAAMGGAKLPPEKGSKERLHEAARFAVKKISKAYAGYYIGVADVGLAMADVATEVGKERTAEVLKESAFLWMLRARCLRGVNVDLVAKGADTNSNLHHRVYGPNVDLALAPSPYRAFKGYAKHVQQSKLLPRRYKQHIAQDWRPPLSAVFRTWSGNIYPIAKSVLTRYIMDPASLGDDMERAWMDLVGDMKVVMKRFVEEAAPPPKKEATTSATTVPAMVRQINLMPEGPPAKVAKTKMSYWEATGWLDEDQMQGIEDIWEKLGSAYEDLFIEKEFDSTEDLIAQILALEKEFTPEASVNVETVR